MPRPEHAPTRFRVQHFERRKNGRSRWGRRLAQGGCKMQRIRMKGGERAAIQGAGSRAGLQREPQQVNAFAFDVSRVGQSRGYAFPEVLTKMLAE